MWPILSYPNEDIVNLAIKIRKIRLPHTKKIMEPRINKSYAGIKIGIHN